MTFDPFAVIAVVVGLVALTMAIRRDRRPLSAQAQAQVRREGELAQRVTQLESTVATLQRLLYEKQKEIDALNQRIQDLERGVAVEGPGERRRVLLVGVGEDAMLQEDLAHLRRVQAQTNIRLSRLLPVSKASLERTIERHRSAGTPVKLLHLAVHSSPNGLIFSDGLADGMWLSQQLAGVEIAVLAGCEGDQIADLLAVVPAVVSMREEVENRDASIFAGAFWLAVGQGLNANEAFERALQRAPAVVGEYVELHL